MPKILCDVYFLMFISLMLLLHTVRTSVVWCLNWYQRLRLVLGLQPKYPICQNPGKSEETGNVNLGGAKSDTKITLIPKLAERADEVLIGGLIGSKVQKVQKCTCHQMLRIKRCRRARKAQEGYDSKYGLPN